MSAPSTINVEKVNPETGSVSTHIHIELCDSTTAKITIDGREMEYNLCGKNAGLHPFTDEERTSTIGAIIARRIITNLGDILQGYMADEPKPDGDSYGTWDRLPDSVAAQVYDRVNRF